MDSFLPYLRVGWPVGGGVGDRVGCGVGDSVGTGVGLHADMERGKVSLRPPSISRGPCSCRSPLTGRLGQGRAGPWACAATGLEHGMKQVSKPFGKRVQPVPYFGPSLS